MPVLRVANLDTLSDFRCAQTTADAFAHALVADNVCDVAGAWLPLPLEDRREEVPLEELGEAMQELARGVHARMLPVLVQFYGAELRSLNIHNCCVAVHRSDTHPRALLGTETRRGGVVPIVLLLWLVGADTGGLHCCGQTIACVPGRCVALPAPVKYHTVSPDDSVAALVLQLPVATLRLAGVSHSLSEEVLLAIGDDEHDDAYWAAQPLFTANANAAAAPTRVVSLCYRGGIYWGVRWSDNMHIIEGITEARLMPNGAAEEANFRAGSLYRKCRAHPNKLFDCGLGHRARRIAPPLAPGLPKAELVPVPITRPRRYVSDTGYCLPQAIASLLHCSDNTLGEMFENGADADGTCTFGAISTVLTRRGVILQRVRGPRRHLGSLLGHTNGLYLLQLWCVDNTRDHVIAFNAELGLLMDGWTYPDAYRLHCRRFCCVCQAHLTQIFRAVVLHSVRRVCAKNKLLRI